MLSILSDPNIVLTVSISLFRCKSLLVGFDVFDRLPDIIFCLSESVRVIISHLGICSNLSLMVMDGVVEVVQNSIASTDISSSNIIMLLLVLVQSRDDFIEKHVNFFS